MANNHAKNEIQMKSKKLFKSYHVNKSLRPAAPAALPVHEPAQNHKLTPSIPVWLNYWPFVQEIHWFPGK